MRYVTAKYVADEMLDRYGIAMEEWDVVKLSASCLKRIGNFATRRKVAILDVKNFKTHLPCDAYLLRECTSSVYNYVSGTKLWIKDGIDHPPQIFWVGGEPATNEIQGEATLVLDANRPLPGDYIDYTYEHPILSFNETNLQVMVRYTGIVTDEQGIPMIPESCWEACMMFCIFTKTQANYLRGQAPRHIALDSERWKDTSISQSRAKATMESFTANELDKLLNIMVSMDRKAYNIPS